MNSLQTCYMIDQLWLIIPKDLVVEGDLVEDGGLV